MKQLKISKNKVYVFEMVQKTDSQGNTYKTFTEAYYLKEGKRSYIGSEYKGFEIGKSFYSYGDALYDVKGLLNQHHDAGIKWMSEHQNVVVFCKEVSRGKFDRLTKLI